MSTPSPVFRSRSYFNLLKKGVAPDDINVMLMDHGIVLYGNAIMVNPDFARANPKVVAGFVRATVKGFIETAKNPEEAVKSVMKRNETGDAKIYFYDRLKTALQGQHGDALRKGERASAASTWRGSPSPSSRSG